MAKQARVRWYNPKLGVFEWREVPESDEEALASLEGSPHTPACTETYRAHPGESSSQGGGGGPSSPDTAL